MSLATTLLWVLCALAVAATIFTAYALATRGKEDSFFIALLRAFTWNYVRLVHHVKVRGCSGDCLPPQGPCIMVSDHRSGVDSVILSVLTRRRVRFLVAREYYEMPVLHRMFRALRCIPVKRDGADFGGTKQALRALRAGEVIGIFPQGGIRRQGEPFEGKAGVALLALRGRAAVVPIHIEGSPNLDSVFGAVFTPSRTVIHVGPPLSFEKSSSGTSGKTSRAELERVTEAIFDAIGSLGREKPL